MEENRKGKFVQGTVKITVVSTSILGENNPAQHPKGVIDTLLKILQEETNRRA